MSDPTQYPFNRKAALAGAAVVTRTGKRVYGLFDSKDLSQWPLEQAGNDPENWINDSWDTDGCDIDFNNPSPYDLFMVEPNE